MSTDQIRITYDPPPIPSNRFDWCALRHANYEPGAPIGFGASPIEALEDLMYEEEIR